MFIEGLNDAVRRHQDVEVARIVRDEIARVIFPFDPGLVELSIVERIDSGYPTIHILATTFCDNEAVIPGRPLYNIRDVEDMARWAGKQAGLYFDSLRNEPIPNTVVLGDN